MSNNLHTLFYTFTFVPYSSFPTSYQKCKRHIKDDQTFQNIVYSGKNQLVCRQNGFLGHEVVVNGIYQEVIGEYAENSHDQSSCNGTDQGPGAVPFKLINKFFCANDRKATFPVAKNRPYKLRMNKRKTERKSRPEASTKDAPRIKLLNSPTPPVLDIRRWSRFLIRQIITPAMGP